ncbi:terpene synthase [Kitasatospora sp. NPDC093102]|uniref:terpene synthase family protein n=1 Tax=Kitasatospora sp. NPDC093102 TaxID=3155069 RepID=UPI00343BA19E
MESIADSLVRRIPLRAGRVASQAGTRARSSPQPTAGRAADPALLAVHCYPTADAEVLALAAEWLAWRFEQGGHESARGPQVVEQHALQAAALGVPAGVSEEPGASALRDLVERVADGMGEAWRLRFGRHVCDYLSAEVRSAARRAAGHVPELDGFAEQRRDLGAVLASFDLVEKAVGAPLPPVVYFSRPYQGMLLAAADTVCWTDDLLTADAPRTRAGHESLVTVVGVRQRLLQPDARAYVSVLCEERLDRFFADQAELASLCAELRLPDGLRRLALECADLLACWMRGQLEWGWRTGRYPRPTEV